MLVFSEKRYLPTKLSVITLECPNGGYIYADMKSYNSGVLLSQNEEYSSKEKLLIAAKPKNAGRRKSIEDFYDKLPNPLKPLAYLLYLTGEDYKDFSEQVGALNIILQFIYPTYWFSTPKEQRLDMNFGTSVKAEYELDWKNFFENSIRYDDIVNPKENKEKFPIYVINAAYSENPFNMTAANTISKGNQEVNHELSENGDAVIDIDFDSLPDIEEDEAIETVKQGKEESKPLEKEVSSKTSIDAAYAKLLS